MMSETFSNVNKRFKSACKSVFGQEIGELSDYAEWLSEEMRPVIRGKSCLSGKDVTFSSPFPPKDGKFVAFSEVDFFTRPLALKSSDLEGISAVKKAIKERIIYCGNVVLGNSMNVESSTNVIDCLDVYGSEHIAYSKGVGYTCEGSYNESIFGCNGIGQSSFLIRCFGLQKSTRCFECMRSDSCSDCFLSAGLNGCKDCIFCFNLKNKQYCIGNAQLSREEYSQVKERLISEIVSALKRDGRLIPLVALAEKAPADYSMLKRAHAKLSTAKKGETLERKKVQRVFSETFKLILGKEHGDMDWFDRWLTHDIMRCEQAVSCASGRPIAVWEYANYMTFPKKRLLSLEESELLGEMLAIPKESALGIALSNAAKEISPIAFFSPEWHVGVEKNVIESPLNVRSTNMYKCVLGVESKNCAFSYVPRNSENSFGSYLVRLSAFAIRCFKSAKLRRCFECDSCRDCSDLLFCHNCESCNDCMFCFNAKNLRYAIGNCEMPREEYLKVKARILEEVNSELSGKKGLSTTILSLSGAAARAR
ncbi:MAG: hypothetical protein WC861_06960 [Candidatus Micrarchaeia archaeon]|jgi:hypothetical protein